MKTLSNGSILFSRSDKPIPEYLKGFKRNRDNPMLFEPAFPDCDYLFCKQKKLPCGRMAAVHVCLAQKELLVAPTFCAECTIEPKKIPPEVKSGLQAIAAKNQDR